MDVLHYLDVGIGFTMAMMVLATLIGTVTAAWLAAIRSKVRNLEHGLQQVLAALDDRLGEAERAVIVGDVLRHRMMAAWSPVRRLGFGATDAIGREEFAIQLLRLATAQPTSMLAETLKTLTNQTPADVLRAVEHAILVEETSAPSAPAHVWRTRALAKAAPDLAARLFVQFDDVLARADDNAVFSRKLVSAVFALAFLLVYPVNSFDLMARLINDKTVAASVAATAASETDPAKLRAAINDHGLFGDVFSANPSPRKALSEPGVWTTFVLVSLGAPFWQGLLDKLLGLRSKIAAKTEGERHHRATQQ